MMKYLLATICTAILLISCNSNDDLINPDTDEPAIYPKAQRTVIVYISAENNLSSNATSDINEMVTGSEQLPDNVNLIAFVDKKESTPPYILRIKGGRKEKDTYYDNPTDFYASDPERMYETLHWIMTRYPADTYGLVLWGHASGWVIENDSTTTGTTAMNRPQRAYGVDYGTDIGSSDNKRMWMNIPSMADALGRLQHKLLFIFADCCNFQCAEVAYELRNVTDYIIGSPAEIPGAGAPYQKVVPDMFDTSETFYEKIVDDYHAVVTNGNEQVPLSVVKTSEMANLAQATRNITTMLGNAENISTANTIYYRTVSDDYKSKLYHVEIMYDMNDFILNNIGDSDYNAYIQWKRALDKAVVYKAKSNRWMTMFPISFNFDMTDERFGGMSMFVPLAVYDENNLNLNSTIKQMSWYYAAGVDKCYTDGIKN